MFRSILVSLCSLFAIAANAQVQSTTVYIEDSTIKAYSGNVQKQLAWSGGFNNPQFTMGDINHDGKQDLVVYDYHSDQIKTFLNVGTPGNAHYIYAPKYEANFGRGNNYLILADYNRDGIPDMFNKGLGGFDVYKGYYNADNELAFTYYKQLRYNIGSGGTANANSNGGDIPSIVDVDGDGDLDFFGYNEGGAIIYFFKNCQVEHGLPNDSIEVCKPTNCWGYFNQGGIRSFVLGVTDGDQVFCPSFNNYDCRGTKHGGNTICLLDLDGDGDYDILDGNFNFNDLQAAYNGKKQYNSLRDSMVTQDSIWKGMNVVNWPAAFSIDADGDGKKDILVSPHGVNISENYKCILYYRNTGTSTAPVFTLQSDTFLIDQGIDIGTASYPFIYDYDRDGRADLFIGSSGYFQTGGLFRSKVTYYKNVLVNGEAHLQLQSGDFNNIFAENVEGAAPAFGDLDNDGKDDLLIGHTNGTISFYRNTAASNSVQPVFAAPVILKDGSGNNLRSANYAVPFVYDLTKDGKPDLLVAGQLGRVALYQNTGATGTISMSMVTDTLGGMYADGAGFYQYASIYVGKVDSTGKDYILLGNNDGQIRRYGGFESGNTNMSYQLIDNQYSGIDVGYRSAVAVGDLDGDGRHEMILGNLLGGLNQFRESRQATSTGIVAAHATQGDCNVYPNPASDKLYITWDQKFAGNDPVNVHLINMTGQTVARVAVNGNQLMSMLSIDNYPAGMYVCLVQAGNNILSQRVVIRK